MTRCRLAVLVLVALASPAGVRAQAEPPSCNLCEHLCMWSPLLQSAMTTQQLFQDSDFVNSVGSVQELDREVNKTMSAWLSLQGQLKHSPCYKIIVQQFYGGEEGASPDLDAIISNLPPSGNLFHMEYDKPGCPIVPNNPQAAQMMCGALFDAYEKHEEVHQQQCLSLWKKGGKKAAVKAFSNPKFFAASEAKAYETQIQLMRQSMQKLIDRKGCNVSNYSIKDFAPKSGPSDIQKARNLAQALQMANDFNAGKGGKK